MRKFVSLISVFAALTIIGTAAFPAASFADTAMTTTTVSSSIQVELNLITSLEQQIQSLMQQIQSLRTQVASTTVSLVQNLSLGSQGEQVSVLQALLAANPSIYPQGLITGYFGPLTERAVKQYQAENGIEQVGIVGPQTRAKLNQDLGEHPVEFENTAPSAMNGENEGEGNGNANQAGQGQNGQGEGHGHLCAIVPPGHLIAPGWLRKNGGEEPIVPECQTLPPGIEQQLTGISTTPTPTTMVTLAVSGVATSVTTSTATVSWSTNLAANSQVNYGPTSAYGSSTALDSALVTSHSEVLTGLAPDTMYHFEVVSANASGTATSADATFTTNALPEMTPPAISSITFSAASTTANIVWTTDEAATGEVYYGTVTPLDLTATSTVTVSTSTLSTSHSFNLSGLTASTTYYYVVQSTDGSGNTATSSEQSFVTTQ